MTKRDVREIAVLNQVSATVDVPGYEFVGYTFEGAAFMNKEGESFVVRTIIKLPRVDIMEDVKRYQDFLEENGA